MRIVPAGARKPRALAEKYAAAQTAASPRHYAYRFAVAAFLAGYAAGKAKRK